MASRQVDREDSEPQRRHRPPTTPEAQNNHMINLAMDLAEKQLREGNASAQVLTHYLKAGSMRERLEQQKIKHEIELMEQKKEMMASAKRVEEMYGQALNAMRAYSGQDPLAMEGSDDEDGY